MQTGVTAVLARLLTPSEFGVVAMALVLLRFAQYFAQMGAGQAIVQKPELSERDVHAAFTSAALIGLAFCLLIVALAPLATVLFPDTPGVVPVMRVMSLTLLVGGLTATTQGLLRRRFAFRAIALAEIGSYLIGYALVGVVLASCGLRGVEPRGRLPGTGCDRGRGLHALLPPRHRPRPGPWLAQGHLLVRRPGVAHRVR